MLTYRKKSIIKSVCVSCIKNVDRRKVVLEGWGKTKNAHMFYPDWLLVYWRLRSMVEAGFRG